MSRRRVVITGLGLISPVGNSVAEGWANILAGRSGITIVEEQSTPEADQARRVRAFSCPTAAKPPE